MSSECVSSVFSGVTVDNKSGMYILTPLRQSDLFTDSKLYHPILY